MSASGGRQRACDSTPAGRGLAKFRPGPSAKVTVALSKGA
jgi:hypothetical protein